MMVQRKSLLNNLNRKKKQFTRLWVRVADEKRYIFAFSVCSFNKDIKPELEVPKNTE